MDNVTVNTTQTIDNITATITENVEQITINISNTRGADGLPGEPGIPGEDGEDGYTPIKGVDYFDGINGTNGLQGVQGVAGENGVGVPVGGTTNQILCKIDNTNFNTQWIDNLGGSGDSGVDGREIQLQKSSTHIQWKYDTDLTWNDLVLLSELKGDQGIQGIQGITGSQGLQGIQGNPGTNGTNGTNGVGVPTGGTTGQVLSKIDATNYNTQWVNQTGGVGGGYISTDISYPPLVTELTAALGTPSTLGAGYTAIVKDTGTDPNVILVGTDGTNWYHSMVRLAGTDAVPTSYSNLQYWFDAQQITGVSDNTILSRWVDLSGNGRDLTAVIGREPLFFTGGLNAKPCVRTDGVNDYMTASGTGVTNFTLMLVIYVRNRTADNTGIMSLCPPTGSDWNNADGFVVSNYVADNTLVIDRSVGAPALDLSGGVNSLTATPEVLTIRFASGRTLIRVNGFAYTTTTYGDLTPLDFSSLLIGARYLNSVVTGYGNVDYGEILLYSDAKNDRDIFDLENQLKVKWGIS
jgi:hypothetical protein